MRNPTFFCLNAASGSLHEDLSMFYCCGRHKFSIKALLCNTQYSCMVDSDMQLNNTHRSIVMFPLQQWLRECASVTLYVHCLYCIRSSHKYDVPTNSPTLKTLHFVSVYYSGL